RGESQRSHHPIMSLQPPDHGSAANVPQHNVTAFIFIVGQRLAVRRKGKSKRTLVMEIGVQIGDLMKRRQAPEPYAMLSRRESEQIAVRRKNDRRPEPEVCGQDRRLRPSCRVPKAKLTFRRDSYARTSFEFRLGAGCQPSTIRRTGRPSHG